MPALRSATGASISGSCSPAASDMAEGFQVAILYRACGVARCVQDKQFAAQIATPKVNRNARRGIETKRTSEQDGQGLYIRVSDRSDVKMGVVRTDIMPCRHHILPLGL